MLPALLPGDGCVSEQFMSDFAKSLQKKYDNVNKVSRSFMSRNSGCPASEDNQHILYTHSLSEQNNIFPCLCINHVYLIYNHQLSFDS